ncbi:MAG: hypothetical protein ACLP1X_16535 [Polyangiaceae bacterium]
MRARHVSGAALAATALLLFFYIARFHEFWRDEAQTALIARAVPLANLLHPMRNQAVPPIVYCALKVLRVFPPPYSLSAFAAIGFASLLAGTYQLLLTICGSPVKSALATAAFALTDTYCYELGVVVRQYGLGLGFALACVAYLARAIAADGGRDARLGAAFGALAVSTSVHPGCLAGSALLAYSVERLVRKRTVLSVAEPLCALPAFLLTFFLLTPYDRAPEMLGVFHRTATEALAVIGASLLDGALCHGWWTPENIDPLKHGIVVLACAGLLGAVLLHAPDMRRRPDLAAFYTAAVLLNALTLSYIFVVRNEGFYRHHLFTFMPAMVMTVGLLLSPTGLEEPSWTWRLGPACLLVPWFLFQYWACGTDLVGDARGAFSGTKAAAAALPPGARVVVAGQDWVGLGILYWRPDVAMRAQSSKGRPFRYLVQDWEWHDEVPLLPLLIDECRKASDVYVIAPIDGPPIDTRCADHVLTPPSFLPTERISVFDLHCACLAGLAAEVAHCE